jgi:uncharacterized membrane protein YccF (DUF307 family)
MKKWIIIGLITLVFVIYTITFNMAPNTLEAATLIPFDKNGFTEAEELSDSNKLVSTSGRYSLYLDETTSHFTVVDSISNTVWELSLIHI